ncbi:hypothetical protein D3C73_1186530 [compost metagenome]
MPFLGHFLPPLNDGRFIFLIGDDPVLGLHEQRRQLRKLTALFHMPYMTLIEKTLPAVGQCMERRDSNALQPADIPAVLLKGFTEDLGIMQLPFHLLYPA